MKLVPTKKTHVLGAALFAAALALPAYQTAFAEATPEKGVVAFKYLNYKDSQPGNDRIGVNAITGSLMMPFAGTWTVSSSYTYDSVSGASPTHHDVVSSASIKETRNAGDLSFTKYLPNGSWAFGLSYSKESDYVSNGYSVQRSLSTEDKNTTVTFGGSYTTDTVGHNNYATNPPINVEVGKKEIYSGLFGVTKILSKVDIIQLNIGFSKGDGYFTDPYKSYDIRPKQRNITTLMARWNHHFENTDGTSHLSYRYYTDSYEVAAHTLTAEYLHPLPNHLTIIPSLRFSSQSAAYFYHPYSAADYPPADAVSGIMPYSMDQRLSGFGALTLGMKAEKKLASSWTADLKLEYYKQLPGWCINGSGDSQLKEFNFTSIQLGVSHEL